MQLFFGLCLMIFGFILGVNGAMSMPETKKALQIMEAQELLIKECEKELRRDQHCIIIQHAEADKDEGTIK